MTIETKFKPGDKVWVIFEGKAKEFPIHVTRAENYLGKELQISYTLETQPNPNFQCKLYEEKECFETRDDLIASL